LAESIDMLTRSVRYIILMKNRVGFSSCLQRAGVGVFRKAVAIPLKSFSFSSAELFEPTPGASGM